MKTLFAFTTGLLGGLIIGYQRGTLGSIRAFVDENGKIDPLVEDRMTKMVNSSKKESES